MRGASPSVPHDPPDELRLIVYVSAIRKGCGPATVRKILASSRSNNQRDGITGLLIFHDHLFYHMLEGPADAVDACLNRIQRDDRHAEFSLIWDGSVERRRFPGFPLAFAAPDDDALRTDSEFRSWPEILQSAAEDAQVPSISDLLVEWIVRECLPDLLSAKLGLLQT